MSGDDYAFKSFLDRMEGECPDDKPAWKPLDAQRVVALARNAVDIKDHCESPIETQLGAKLLTWLPIVFPTCGAAICRQGKQASHPESRILVIPQYVRGNYRWDLAVEQYRKLLTLVECDGREFHSSDEARARDRAKDESAVKDGIVVFRFTGKEIFLAPDQCVAAMAQHLKSVVREAA